MSLKTRRGQAATEYVVVVAALAVVVVILFGLVRVAERYAARTERLVTSDSP